MALTAIMLGLGCHAQKQPQAQSTDSQKWGRHPDAVGAIRKCEQGLRTVSQADPAARQSFLPEACGDLFVEPRCRDAWKNSAQVPLYERVSHLVQECREAYCPLLTEPKPELCSASLTIATAEDRQKQLVMWTDLFRRIVILDLGLDAPANLPLAGHSISGPLGVAATQLPDPGTAPTWPIPVVILTKDALKLHWRSPAGDLEAPSLEIAKNPRTNEAGARAWDCPKLNAALAAMVTKLWPDVAARPESSQEILLVASPEVAYGDVVPVMDCVRTWKPSAAGPGNTERPLYPQVIFSSEGPK